MLVLIDEQHVAVRASVEFEIHDHDRRPGAAGDRRIGLGEQRAGLQVAYAVVPGAARALHTPRAEQEFVADGDVLEERHGDGQRRAAGEGGDEAGLPDVSAADAPDGARIHVVRPDVGVGDGQARGVGSGVRQERQRRALGGAPGHERLDDEVRADAERDEALGVALRRGVGARVQAEARGIEEVRGRGRDDARHAVDRDDAGVDEGRPDLVAPLKSRASAEMPCL